MLIEAWTVDADVLAYVPPEPRFRHAAIDIAATDWRYMVRFLARGPEPVSLTGQQLYRFRAAEVRGLLDREPPPWVE